jgi:hypothetical protein
MAVDIRWPLLIVAGVGVVLNLIMLVRLNRHVAAARELALIDQERALAVRSRRRQSIGLLVILLCLSASAFFSAGSGLARLFVFLVAIVADWKSARLFVDRFNADVMAAERLRRDREDEP